MPYQPVGHKTAIAVAYDTQTLFVNIAFFQQYIHTDQDIIGIFHSPGTSYRQNKITTVARTAARIGVEHHITAGGQQLHFMEKTIAVLRIEPAVNLYNHRILFSRIKIKRL